MDCGHREKHIGCGELGALIQWVVNAGVGLQSDFPFTDGHRLLCVEKQRQDIAPFIFSPLRLFIFISIFLFFKQKKETKPGRDWKTTFRGT